MNYLLALQNLGNLIEIASFLFKSFKFRKTFYNYKTALAQLMKRSIFPKKLSDQSIQHSTPDSQTKISKIWRKYSLIFSQPKKNFMNGLLSLAQKRRNSICQSFEEEHTQKQDSNQQYEAKKEVKANPFLMAKARLLKQKQSLQTEDSNPNDKLLQEPFPENIFGIGEKLTITWKQMLQLQQKNQKMVLKPFTDTK